MTHPSHHQRRAAAAVTAALAIAVIVTSAPWVQTSSAVTPRNAQHHCKGPARQAIARADGTVIGREPNHGATKRGTVWLKPLIDNHPVIGDQGRLDARLAVPQPSVQLLNCRGGHYRIRYPACEEWLTGTIRARDPNTRRAAVRIVPAPKTSPTTASVTARRMSQC